MNGKRSVSFLISLILAFILAGGVSAVVFSDDDYINNNQCVLSDPDLNDWSDVLVCKIGQWIGEVAKISELTEEGVIIMADNGEFSDRLGYEEKFILWQEVVTYGIKLSKVLFPYFTISISR